jgi:hypothetical protein
VSTQTGSAAPVCDVCKGRRAAYSGFHFGRVLRVCEVCRTRVRCRRCNEVPKDGACGCDTGVPALPALFPFGV